jgi:hypothetical protein
MQARTVTGLSMKATAIYGIEVISKGQQWIVDQIKNVNVKIAKVITQLKSMTARCDERRNADTLPIRAMVDRCIEYHVIRLLSSTNSNTDHVADALDGQVNESDIPNGDSWSEHTGEDLGLPRDQVEQCLLVDLEFLTLHKEELIEEHGSHIDDYHQ